MGILNRLGRDVRISGGEAATTTRVRAESEGSLVRRELALGQKGQGAVIVILDIFQVLERLWEAA